MNQPLVSIICPVYNASAWLRGCIESVLSQDYARYELLLVDDGSTDGSAEICDEYAAKDSRIKVFHEENGGVSSARNRGLDRMQGDWVCFLDADDEWMGGGLRTLVDGVSEEVDWVMAGYETWDEKGELVYAVPDRTACTLSPEEGLMQIFKPTHYRYLGYVWAKLFRSSVIRERGCRFAEDIRFCEDRLFTVQFACLSQRPVRYLTAPVYRYRLQPGSAMASLEASFDPEFLSDLDATIRIREWVHSAFPEAGTLCKAADRRVYGSFQKLSRRIQTFGYPDTGLRKRLRAKAVRCIGKRAFLEFELKNILGRIWKSCCP